MDEMTACAPEELPRWWPRTTVNMQHNTTAEVLEMVNHHESVCSCKWRWPAEGRDWLLVVLGSSAGGLLASTKIVRSLELNKHSERETHLMHSETHSSCPVGFTPACSEAFSETSDPVASPGVPHVRSSWGSTP